jgi:hypothetical protein
MKHFAFIALGLLFAVNPEGLQAQNSNLLKKGNLNGSFENYSQYYLKDTVIKASVPQGNFGTNSFFKLDYNYDRFTAGIQFETYLPPVQGYFPEQQVAFTTGSKLVNKYFKYSGDQFSVQIGDFYEQYGSGMILRAYENRQIGINNAIQGAKVEVAPASFAKLKFLYGNARELFEYSDAILRGADAEIDINKLFKFSEEKYSLSIGASYVGKYQEYTGPDDFPTTVNSHSLRFDLSGSAFTLDGEYMEKGIDPNYFNFFDRKNKGRGALINAGYSKGNFGSTVSLRSYFNIFYANNRDQQSPNLSPVNFLPALTKQHDNLTSNIYVYGAQVGGETGFQTDIYYTFPSGTALGGKYGTKLAFNYSEYSNLDGTGKLFSVDPTDGKFYSDANFEIKKKWSKKLETGLFLQHMFFNDTVSTAVKDDVYATIVAANVLYKWAPKKSIRVKVEHLYAKTDFKNWVSGLVEFSFSSPYQFFVSDLYNYGDSKIHYYNMGFSLTKKASRFALSYGRQRAGLFCAGGICRILPAATGFTASLTTSFAN